MTKKNFIISYLIIAVLLIIDCTSKALIENNFFIGEELVIIPNFFYITKIYNTGAAWGMGSSYTYILATISLIAGIVAIYFATRNDFKTRKFYSIALCLIIAGAFGNLIDRTLTVFNILNGVIDFFGFTFGSYDFPIFNVADMCLVIGVIMLVIDILFIDEHRKKKQKNG